MFSWRLRPGLGHDVSGRAVPVHPGGDAADHGVSRQGEDRIQHGGVEADHAQRRGGCKMRTMADIYANQNLLSIFATL